jgi:hypothetical protein
MMDIPPSFTPRWDWERPCRPPGGVWGAQQQLGWRSPGPEVSWHASSNQVGLQILSIWFESAWRVLLLVNNVDLTKIYFLELLYYNMCQYYCFI